MPTYDTIYEQKIILKNLVISKWISTELFSFSWWVIVLFLVVTYYIWWKLIDKSRLRELLLFGSFIAVINAFTDIIGTTMGFWGYKTRLLPLVPTLFPFDYTFVPIAFMIIYQFTSTWKSFVLWSGISAAIISFILIPLGRFLQIVEIHNWRYIYTFITILMTAAFARSVLLAVIDMEKKYAHSKSVQAFYPNVQPVYKPLDSDKKDK